MGSLSSKLDAVTVFREGALCRRIVTVPASADRQVRLGGLPLSLDPGSFRARVLSGGGRVVDVRAQFDVEFRDEADISAEQKALEVVAAKIAALQLRHRRVAAEITELQALKPAFLEAKRGEPPRQAPVEAMLALGDFRQSELTPRLKERRGLEQDLKDAQAELQLRQRRLSEASTANRTERAKVSRVAVVMLAEAPAQPFPLELEYRISGARWVPSYALTLEKGLANGTLQMRASIAQSTGEDWLGVAVSLSTAAMSRRADMPELKSLKIGRRQEAPPRSGWREPPAGLEGLFEAYDVTVAPPVAPPAPMVGFGGRRDEPVPDLAPPPPPAPPRSAPMMPPAMAPGGMAMPAMASAPRPSAAPLAQSRSRGGPPKSEATASYEMAPMAKKSSGFGLSRMSAPKDMVQDEEAAAPEYDLDGAPEGGGGGFGEDAFADAALTSGPDLSAQFGDYSRLMMPGLDVGAARRGKLTSGNEWDFAFVAGVSVQIDVIMAIVGRANRAGYAVNSLMLPALCNPVTSVNSFDYRYECSSRLDIASTGQWVLVPVMKCAVGLAPEYVTVPSVEQKVYRTLTLANRGVHALLPGPVDVTSGDEFLMTTSLPAIPPGAEQSHRLGLGVEEAIKVARKTQFKETTGGFLGGSSVLPHDIEIELNNRLAVPTTIEVRERVPVVDPSEKDLKVEEAQITPPWEKVETPLDDAVLKGARRWRVTVPPGQSLKLTAQFAIRMPADRMIVGGNRRN